MELIFRSEKDLIKEYKYLVTDVLRSGFTMVRLRYSPTEDDLNFEVHQLLRHIWNFNTHSNKREHIDCIIYEEWAIEFFKKNWEDDYIDFEIAIRKVQQIDKTFINFDEICIFDEESVYEILKSPNNFF